MNAAELVSRLEGVIPRGDNRSYARCPAHADRSPSLSIRLADDGRILLHDFGGRDAESILDSLGLQFGDLYPDRWEAAREAQYRHRVKLRALDPLEIERWVLKIAAADLRNAKELSVEDRARVEVAKLRLDAAGGCHE